MTQQKITALFDIHAPFQDKACVALAIAHIEDTRPRRLILGGDIVDVYLLNEFKRGNTNGPQYLQDEFDRAKEEVILPLIKVAKKANPKVEIDWVEGNHEDRYTNRLLPRLKAVGLDIIYGGLQPLPEIFDLKKNGITYHPSRAGNGHFALTPHLEVMHGDATGENAAKAQYTRFGHSLIMGHTHRQSTYMVTKGDQTKHVALCSGALSQPPTYMDLHNHALGFIAGWIDPAEGTFEVHHETIHKVGNKYDLYSQTGHLRATVGKDGKVAVTRPGAA